MEPAPLRSLAWASLLLLAAAGCAGNTLPRPAVADRPIRIVALPGGFDALECLPLEPAIAGPIKRMGAAALLEPGALEGIDIVLVSCGAAYEAPLPPAVLSTLRNFVLDGGRVMVTDRSYGVVEGLFPDLIDFEGPGAQRATAQPPAGAFLGPEGNQTARVVDGNLRRHLGDDTFTIRDQQPEWALIRTTSPDAHVFVEGDVTVAGASMRRPLAVAADFPGGGRIVYASFHGNGRERQADPERCPPHTGDATERTLVYLLAYALAPARAQGPPRPAAVRAPPRRKAEQGFTAPMILEDPGMDVRQQ